MLVIHSLRRDRDTGKSSDDNVMDRLSCPSPRVKERNDDNVIDTLSIS